MNPQALGRPVNVGLMRGSAAVAVVYSSLLYTLVLAVVLGLIAFEYLW